MGEIDECDESDVTDEIEPEGIESLEFIIHSFQYSLNTFRHFCEKGYCSVKAKWISLSHNYSIYDGRWKAISRRRHHKNFLTFHQTLVIMLKY